MVDADYDADNDLRTVTKLLKSFYKLVIARPDKSLFLCDPSFSVTITTYLDDGRPEVMQIMARILGALTDNSKNCKLVAALPSFEQKLAKQIEKPDLPPKVVHQLLVVQSRIAALNTPKTPQKFAAQANKPLFKSAGTKQLVYLLQDSNEEKQSVLQERSVTIKGVVSLCFAQGDHHAVKCIYRVQENFVPEIIERIIFNCGFSKIQRMVRLDDGSTQSYEIFRDEVFNAAAEKTALSKEPKYLDEIAVFEDDQSVIPKDHTSLNQNSNSWFNGVKAYLPSFW